MFGPKNAPATQVQYLYLPCKGNSAASPLDAESLKLLTPARGAVLTITQFDGIPMADIFKVMQYWTFESSHDLSNRRCTVRVGLAIHFIKTSMFKSQIINGTKDELGEQVCTMLSSAANTMDNLLSVLSSGEDVVFIFGRVLEGAED
jgi:hypothetical protein